PVQARVLPITDDHADGAAEVVDRLRAAGLEAELDARSDTLSYRVRDGEMQKVPYLLVVGDRELEAGTVAVRARGSDRKQVVMPLDEFVAKVTGEISGRELAP
ncbi:MAG: His/Gly/Thr/Pro-type tRNA ligase C-terminal domain-containing protein, partial [marine benthic group bacterium]|nr:His/Gly/Thr/Pro-type tRNA ligase C-terminal domain-containing protein [Candidatus Carthagonibacter metallireducens]MCL7966661.1 His/Gly/Thr/Pro-type tRNA ligase C-terminal domain-containing protein [Gemmatimonadota bacterium]